MYSSTSSGSVLESRSSCSCTSLKASEMYFRNSKPSYDSVEAGLLGSSSAKEKAEVTRIGGRWRMRPKTGRVSGDATTSIEVRVPVPSGGRVHQSAQRCCKNAQNGTHSDQHASMRPLRRRCD